jgi:hypothetical protein
LIALSGLIAVLLNKDKEVIIASAKGWHSPVDYCTHKHFCSALLELFNPIFHTIGHHLPAIAVAAERIAIAANFVRESEAVVLEEAISCG